MTTEINWKQALNFIDLHLQRVGSPSLNNIEEAILKGIWLNHQYRQIAKDSGYEYTYISRDASRRFLQRIAKLFDVPSPVKKKELRQLIIHEYQKEITSLPTRRVSRTSRGYIEPLLLVGDAVPLHMVLVPRGKFTIGSPEDELERSDAEGPQYEVTVPAFFMSRYPVTQAQYKSLMQVNPATKYDMNRFVAPNKPVVGVSWKDTAAFCNRLAELTHRPYRLPSESEWEYACRAGTTTPFYFGETLSTEVANYDSNYIYANGSEERFRNALTEVNHFGIANAFGLSDMHGNIQEWCHDQWHDNYKGGPTDGSAWIGGGDSSRRVLRSGCWRLKPGYCRSAFRSPYSINDRGDGIGFRVVCSAPRPFQ